MTIAPRTRTRPAAAGSQPSSGGGWMKTGSDARAVQEQEIVRQREQAERRANGFMPFRFWVPIGESREVVVLDAEPGPCFYEHQLQGPNGKWDIYETCPKEFEACPICDGSSRLEKKDSYYVMMLTVMDLTPFSTKEGKEIPHSRKLLPVKAQQQGFFHRQFDRHGTLRGIQLLMSRDTKQTGSIGNPEFVEKHSEEAILQAFGHPEIKSSEGKVVKEANADCFAIDYAKFFKQPSGADLRQRYGGSAPAGSREQVADEWSGGTDMSMDDDIPF